MLITLLIQLMTFLAFDLPSQSTISFDCTDLVVWGSNLSSNVGFPRFSPLISSMISLPLHVKGIIVGLILSDASLRFVHPRVKNCTLSFQQSLSHCSYFLFVFNLLSHYCKALPKSYTRKSNGSLYYVLEFYTRALPCFTELYNLFYVNGVKIIPNIFIYELLTPVALAHWIMGDGKARSSGLILCTHSFTIPEVVLLMNVLMVRYQIQCTLQLDQGKPLIYIRSRSMPLLGPIVLPHMDGSMLYLIGL
jgi:hypothetical protein